MKARNNQGKYCLENVGLKKQEYLDLQSHPAMICLHVSACARVVELKIDAVTPAAPNAAMTTIKNIAVLIGNKTKHYHLSMSGMETVNNID